jgi:hypothetical protein
MGADSGGLGANAGYMIAAYAVTMLIVVGYAMALWSKARKLRRK